MVADVSSVAERGTHISFVVFAVMIGPAIGPILGVLIQSVGWRSKIWFLVITSVMFFVPVLVAFLKTGTHIVTHGSMPPGRWNMSILNYVKTRKTDCRAVKAAQNTEHAIKPDPKLRSLRESG